jgi:hypothetical protein
MNLARLGEENLAKFGEYVALHFEGRDITIADQDRAAGRIASPSGGSACPPVTG